MSSSSSQDPRTRPRYARPFEAASSAAIWPAISTGCTVNGFMPAGPIRTRLVAAAISSRAGSGGWNQRSLNTQTVAKPADSAAAASAA